jgi:sialate O-acetylesterase
MRFLRTTPLKTLLCLLASTTLTSAAIKLPAIFGDHMVLQRQQFNPVWGQADPGERITVRINGQQATAYAGLDGRWKVKLKPMPAGGPYTLEVAGRQKLRFEDVMVGEVWLCSGQSNMKWSVAQSDGGDLEVTGAASAQLRMLSVPHYGSQQAQWDFKGKWQSSNRWVAASFSAVGYHFGQRIQRALGVTVGLIDNAWGGSSAEAWLPREVLEAYPRYHSHLEEWDVKAANYTDAMHAERVANWRAWNANGRVGKAPPWPNHFRDGQQRPANLYNGVLHPIIGYGMRGVIWYQGESNVARASDYAHLFPLLISTWREQWQQGDFPFYWVQLADYLAEPSASQQRSAWAELREAQTESLSVANSGQAVIIDCGEGRDIHPRNKRTVADRLARHALAKTYGFELACESPRFATLTLQDAAVEVRFEHVSAEGLYAFDVAEVQGFELAGADGSFYRATAEIVAKDRVRVVHPEIAEPTMLRYGWADNPVVNLFDRNGLPVTPFRAEVVGDTTAESVESAH